MSSHASTAPPAATVASDRIESPTDAETDSSTEPTSPSTTAASISGTDTRRAKGPTMDTPPKSEAQIGKTAH